MAKPEETDYFDIYNLELKLREKLNELHWKTESLDEAQKELSELRRSLYETQALLEDERRSSKQLETQLKSSAEATRRVEDENMKIREENVRMRMKSETAEIERDVLVTQARIAKLENMELKNKMDELEASNASGKATKATLEKSLLELSNNVSRVHTTMRSNAEKLEREQLQLKKSVASSLQLSQRVQSIVKTSHVARERDKMRIDELQKRVAELVTRETPPTGNRLPPEDDRTDVGTLHLKIEATLQELRRKLENNSIDDKLSVVCDVLRKADGRFVTD